jgi:hypothetical protein
MSIWYACYGSNISEERFLKYIQGGQLASCNNFINTYRECILDKSPPQRSEPYIINHKLYFSRASRSWCDCGVAFLSPNEDRRYKTFGKLYLISDVQFIHLFTQENGRREPVNIDFSLLLKNGQLNFNFRLYNQIMLLNHSYNGHPICTFTNSSEAEFRVPAREYLDYIKKGIMQTYKINQKVLSRYFLRKGVA